MGGACQMIGSDLLRYDKNRKYFAFDFETTGLNLYYDLPWQVSYSVFTIDRILEEHNFFIWWDNLEISQDAARVTRFDFNTYKNLALDSSMVLKSFEAYLYDPEIYPVGHNLLGYDTMIHKTWRNKLGFEPDYSYINRLYDTAILSKAYKKGWKIDRSDLQSCQYRYAEYIERGLKTNLAQMGREFDIQFDPNKLHDAKEDIRLNIEVFKKLIWKIEI